MNACNSCGSPQGTEQCQYCPTVLCRGCHRNHEFVCQQAAQFKSRGLGPTVRNAPQMTIQQAFEKQIDRVIAGEFVIWDPNGFITRPLRGKSREEVRAALLQVAPFKDEPGLQPVAEPETPLAPVDPFASVPEFKPEEEPCTAKTVPGAEAPTS